MEKGCYYALLKFVLVPRGIFSFFYLSTSCCENIDELRFCMCKTKQINKGRKKKSDQSGALVNESDASCGPFSGLVSICFISSLFRA